MTPYQFGIKMAIKTAAAPQAMRPNDDPPSQPMTSGQRVEEYMRTINQPPKPPRVPRVAPPKPQMPVPPNLNTSMLMGNNPPQYSQAYSQQLESMGNMPVDDIDVGPLDVPSKPSPSFMSSVPSTKQLMAKVIPQSPFNLAKTPPAPAPLPQPAPTDVAKF